MSLTREKSAQNFDGAVYRRTYVIGERGSANDIKGWFDGWKANATWKRKKTSLQGLENDANTKQTDSQYMRENVTERRPLSGNNSGVFRSRMGNFSSRSRRKVMLGNLQRLLGEERGRAERNGCPSANVRPDKFD